nr:uncharacterized protein LOC100397075 isoform X1 [Callithrix jacchus]
MTFRLRLLRETCRPHPFRGTGKPSAQRHPCDVTVTVRFRDGAREGGSLGCADPSQPPLQETFGAQDMSGMRRYEVALEAEEEIYWGCFYFFPWLRMWRRERSSAHPGEQKLEPLRGLMSCLSSGLGPAPQRSGRGLPRRSPAAAVQPASALKI